MQSNTNTTLAVGTGVFLSVFSALCVTFEPTMAFALSLVVLESVKNF